MKKKTLSKSKIETVSMEKLFENRLQRHLSIIVITILSVVICAAAGYGLDIMFSTGKTFFIIGIVCAFFISQFFIIRKMKRYAHSMTK